MGNQEDTGRFGSADRAVAASPSSPSVSPVPASIPSASRAEVDAWLEANCGRGLPYDNATDLPTALHGLAYVLRQIESTVSYKVFIGQPGPATSAIRWALDHFAAQAIEARRAEPGTGSVHESAVGDADAPGGPQ